MKIIETKEIYKGKGVTVEQHTTVNPDGETRVRDVVVRPDAVAIAAITTQNEVVLLKQFRVPASGWVLEMPAGKIDPGESPKDAAIRELIEETGYKSDEMIQFATILASPGYSNEKVHLFIAKNAYDGEANPQGEEKYNSIIKVTLEKLVDFLLEEGNGVVDGKTLNCALALTAGLVKV